MYDTHLNTFTQHSPTRTPAELRGSLALEVVHAHRGLDLVVAQHANGGEGLVVRLDGEVACVGELALDPGMAQVEGLVGCVVVGPLVGLLSACMHVYVYMCGHGVWMDPSGRTGERIYTYVHGHVGGPELGEEHDVVDGLGVREEEVGRLVGRGSRPGAVHLHAAVPAAFCGGCWLVEKGR